MLIVTLFLIVVLMPDGEHPHSILTFSQYKHLGWVLFLRLEMEWFTLAVLMVWHLGVFQRSPSLTSMCKQAVSGGWSAVTYLYPAGISDDLVGEHELRLGQQFITSDGFDALLPGDGYALHYWEYAYPEWVLDASWVGKTAYSSYEGMLDGVWRKPSCSIGF